MKEYYYTFQMRDGRKEVQFFSKNTDGSFIHQISVAKLLEAMQKEFPGVSQDQFVIQSRIWGHNCPYVILTTKH